MDIPYWSNKTLTIDGKDVKILAEETVLQLATRNRIFIPTLCYDPRLSASGHCKVCLVDISGKLKPACITMAEQGMVVETQSEKAREARKRRVTAILKQHKGNCATGCSVYLDVKGDKVVGVTTDELDTVGRGNLCVKGRFGFTFIHHPDRLKSPLIKSNGSFKEASWDEALSFIAKRFLEIKDRYGPEAIGGIGSARATNEDNYMFQRMMRAAIGTNNIDNCARLCHMPAAFALKRALGISASTSSLADLEYSDVMLVVGSNTTEAHPMVKVTSRRGEITMTLRADTAILPGTVFVSFHLPEIPINMLTGGARDTHTDTYSYKFTAVRVEGVD